MSSSFRPWILASAAVIVGLLFYTRGNMGTSLTGGGLCLALGALSFWYHDRGPGAVVRGMKERWLDLPGAGMDGDLIAVHHGDQPLRIRCSRGRHGLQVSIHTSVGESAVAFRVWPQRLPSPPPIGPFGQAHGGPPLDRAPNIEARFAGTMHVESSDERGAGRILSENLAMEIVAIAEFHKRAFAGLTYDGEYLGVFIQGPMAADPDQSTQLARRLWLTLLP